MFKPDNFAIWELVDKQTYEARGERAWALLDTNALIVLNALREKFGPAVVNNWKSGGPWQWRGLRYPECKEYSRYSQHNFGRAFDVSFKSATAQEVREYILKEWTWNDHKIHITLEDDVSWVHFDTRNAAVDAKTGYVHLFKP